MIELAHRHTRLHRYQQEGRDYHKQRHGYAPEEAVIDRYPKTVVLIDYLGYRSHVIKLLAGVYYHYQQAGNHTDVIYKCYSIFHFLCNLRITRQGLPTAIESDGMPFTTTLPGVTPCLSPCYLILLNKVVLPPQLSVQGH